MNCPDCGSSFKNCLIYCYVCGECIGKDRMNWAKEHLQKYPNHKSFISTNKKSTLLKLGIIRFFWSIFHVIYFQPKVEEEN